MKSPRRTRRVFDLDDGTIVCMKNENPYASNSINESTEEPTNAKTPVPLGCLSMLFASGACLSFIIGFFAVIVFTRAGRGPDPEWYYVFSVVVTICYCIFSLLGLVAGVLALGNKVVNGWNQLGRILGLGLSVLCTLYAVLIVYNILSAD